MCGICGVLYFDRDRRATEAEVVRMRDVQAHRGPDGVGVYLDGPLGFGHRRLSIIDLAGGAQPLANENGSIWVTFNGEIYNFAELKRDLEARGHVFRTHSDTEVIVHLYEELGVDCVAKLNGIFAFALWDAPRRRLVLARDHLGVKPLHYHVGDSGVWFASEIKGVLQGSEVPHAANEGVIREYLMFRNVYGTETLYDGITALEPGSCLTVEDGSVRVRSYWSPRPAEIDPGDDAEWERRVEALLTDAVRMQLMSDVPLGTFCSGGVDSSLTTALAAQAIDGTLNTFTIGYPESSWDERGYARMVCDRYQTAKHEIEVSGDLYRNAFEDALRFNDEPLSHPSSIPLYLLSRLAREHVKVVLSGEGSDEAFGGYPRHQIVKLRKWVEVPGLGAPRRLMASVLRALPFRRGRLIGRSFARTFADGLVLNAAFCEPEQIERLVHPDVPDRALDRRRELVAGDNVAARPLEALAALELRTYLTIALERLDRMSMSASLEARVPFLDPRLVELSMAVPARLKIRGTENKYVIKQIGLRHLPRPVVTRRKVGFGVPVGEWMRGAGPLRSHVDAVRDGPLVRRKIVNERFVHQILDEHVGGQVNHMELVWLLTNLSAWYGRFETSPRPPVGGTDEVTPAIVSGATGGLDRGNSDESGSRP